MIEDLFNIEETISKSRDILSPNELFSDVTVSHDFCDITEFEDRTSWAVQNFLERDSYREVTYSDADLELRKDYMIDFHDNFNEMSGYSNNLCFSNNLAPDELGAFDPETKQIVLNSDLLLDSDPKELMQTIMHESRHAYQDFAINHPDKVYMDNDTLKVWEDNFKHYISPEFDYEAYCNQPVEKDADDFAKNMWNEGASNVA